MRLYAGTSVQFITDTIQNQIAEKLYQSFFNYYRYYPSDNEKRSWQNSLRALKDIFQLGNLNDQGVILEYQLPLTSKRLDCLICGKDEKKKDNAVIIELKQWEKCTGSDGENEVATYVGGGVRDVLHPSAQVGGYKTYLEDTHTAFYETTSPVILNACSYLHNYNYYSDDVIFDNKFNKLLQEFPLFTADDIDKFSNFLTGKLQNGGGTDVLNRIEESKYRPSKKLMDHVGNVIKGNSDYVLLDEQQVIYDKVLSLAKKGFHDKQKNVLIIKGGPGTGKSVIALNLMADLLLQGYNAHYATGSRAFTQTLTKIVGSRSSAQFKYFNSYVEAKENEIDVLICDEAHRIRKTSFDRFHPEKNSGLLQIEEILKASKVAVFFIDDRQIVRPGEIGSVSLIKANANILNAKIFEYQLEAQFRCNGSDGFVNWIDNTLGVRKTANIIWDAKEEFDFKIFKSPFDLEKAIVNKVEKEGNTGRLTAGFCWSWSLPDREGNLLNDVKVGDFTRPWNAKPEARKLAANIPKSNFWAHDPNGINQIGCIYTAQGFEFDYVGVIFGKDLVYRFDKGWVGHPEESKDSVVKKSKDQFLDLVKNTYRVLLSRGMKGCYVYFMDEETEKFFRSRIEEGKTE